MNDVTAERVRQAIVEALPLDTSLQGGVPPVGWVYIPPSHTKALRLECDLVIGARGVGKTFWSAALRSESIRKLLGAAIPHYPRIAKVYTGFGEKGNPDQYPDSDVLASLLAAGHEPYQIWRAVFARWLAGAEDLGVPRNRWQDTVGWVESEPEAFARLLKDANRRNSESSAHELIVFDALDRASNDWRNTDEIVRDLLRVVLSIKPYTNLHAKVFLREDQFEGREITSFADASKLLATRVELTWAPHDLHGLLWHYLCNGQEGAGSVMRSVYHETVGSYPEQADEDLWRLHDAARRDSTAQRSLFVAIAGEWMGRDRRRGIPYTWTVGHLADGRGRTSPRSFLAAVRVAAEDSGEHYPEHGRPIHYESIKRGVQAASNIRVDELAEDYPWVKKLMEPVRGQTVPCPFEAIEQSWSATLAGHPREAGLIDAAEKALPPEHLDVGWPGIRQDLEGLGIFERMRDGRVNMPDLYRVGFGLGRRGGVKPVGKGPTR